MSDIVDQVIQDPCSTLNEKDVEALRSLDKGTLRRLALGLQTQQSAQNQAEESDDEAVQIEELKKELGSTQKNLMKLMGLEKEIRTALQDFGIKTNSVVERTVAVSNQAQTAQELNPNVVWDWVKRSPAPAARMLREGLSALEHNRKKSMDVIITNTSGAYTEEELRRMPISDLTKLAQVLEVRNQYQQDPIMSWEGVGLADQSVNQTPALRVASGGTLDIPSTGTGPLPDQRY